MFSRATGGSAVVRRARPVSRNRRHGAHHATVRPTTHKVLEALFAILDGMIADWSCVRVLDAFAGVGQLGFKSLERGAASAFFIERDGVLAADLKARAARMGATDRVVVLRGDAREALQRVAGPFDVVFLDPPYSEGLAAHALRILGVRDVLAPHGLAVVEHHHKDALPQSAGVLKLLRRQRYGETALTFYRAEHAGKEVSL